MMKKMSYRATYCLIAFLMITLKGNCVTLETTSTLKIYYPDFSRIDLVCGQMPSVSQKEVEFCCEAAFTGELLTEFKHLNIADNHICHGVMKKGYRCRANTGGFVWGEKGWRFMLKSDFPTSANGWHSGFCQLLIIKDGAPRAISSKMRLKRTIYRALCEKGGRICIIEAKKSMTYEAFVKSLVAYQVKHALYLDMGSGWNYAFYRDQEGHIIECFPESKLSPKFRYRTNWITFYKNA